MVEPLYSSEKSTIFYDFSVKDRIISLLLVKIVSCGKKWKIDTTKRIEESTV